ncbi:MAG TPA: hypothetical protein VE338_12310 [Ktedonobacterales bacterium]|nr:hypothetical protein [Ktedonobacterales bacterium]
MNQSPRPEAQLALNDTPSTEATQRQPGPGALGDALSDARFIARALLARFDGAGQVIHPETLPLAAPPVLCAIALLVAQGVSVHWAVALFTLLASLLGLAGIGALITSQRGNDTPDGQDDESEGRNSPETHAEERSEKRRGSREASDAAMRPFALRLGLALLALATVCALPIFLAGSPAALLAAGLGVVGVGLYGVEVVRQRIAPLDEIIAPACLGSGQVALTILAQGQRMNSHDWLLAAAIGGMAFAVIEARRVAAAGKYNGHVLAALIGSRWASLLTALALLASYALILTLAVERGGWPGALLALSSLPAALIGVTGLMASQFGPARRVAAHQLARAYVWAGLGLALGLSLTVAAQNITAAITQAFGL